MPNPVTDHPCPVRGCQTWVGNELLMCGPHWGKVPPELRRAVNSAWRALNHADDDDLKALVKPYQEARAAAIAFVDSYEETAHRIRMAKP